MPLLENEQRVLRFLAPRLPVAIPEPAFIGEPTPDYPWPWSIIPFAHGSTLDVMPLRRAGLMQWADFLVALHRPADAASTPAPPSNPHRGVPLAARAADFQARVEQLERLGVEVNTGLLAFWREALLAPSTHRAVWLHGDPHPRNAVGRGGRLVAVLDWGDVTAGDPASDLASLWMLAHNREDRQDALDRYLRTQQAGFKPGELPSLVVRAQGWALAYGVIHLATGLVNQPAHAAIGWSTLRNLRVDLPPG